MANTAPRSADGGSAVKVKGQQSAGDGSLKQALHGSKLAEMALSCVVNCEIKIKLCWGVVWLYIAYIYGNWSAVHTMNGCISKDLYD